MSLCAGMRYTLPDDTLAVFDGQKRITENFICQTDCELTEYQAVDYTVLNGDTVSPRQSDITNKAATELFLTLTHEKMARVFNDKLGAQLTVMFDDEANTGNWTKDFDRIFKERYGYNINNYLPFIARKVIAGNDDSKKSVCDATMLYGKLFCENDLLPSKE